MGTATALLFPTLLNYEHFLLFIGAMFCPLFGVVLVDYFILRKEVLEPGDLYRKDGRYWFWKGLNLRALAAWSVGFALYLGFSPMLMDKVLGIQGAFPWALGSSLPSMAAAALIYWVLGRKEM